MDPQEIFDLLAAPFPSDTISWRVGPTNDRNRREDQPLRGQPLAYIDARDVMDRLDSVVGPEGWQCGYVYGPGSSIVCNLALRFNFVHKDPNSGAAHFGHEWVWKADGAGPSDTEPEKGALSDAFKRAAVRWGVGRYLYDIKAPWIVLEKRGNTAIIPDNAYPDLNLLLDNYAKRAGWGEASGVAAYRLLVADIERTDAASRVDFVQRHSERIARLPPAMRRHLMTKLEAA